MNGTSVQYALICKAKQFQASQDRPKAQKGKENT